jgi:hypothetical protein
MLNIHVPVHGHDAHHRCVRVRVHVRMRVHVYKCRNAGLTGIQSVGTGMKKLMMPGQVRYQTKPRQSGIFLVQYQTEIVNAGMPMPVLVSWMPMPSYGELTEYINHSR